MITEDKDGAASSRLWDDPNFQAGLAEGKRLIAAKEKAERAKRLAEVLAVEAARKQLKREQRRIYTRGGGDYQPLIRN